MYHRVPPVESFRGAPIRPAPARHAALITGVVSAGAVAALAIVLRPGNTTDLGASGTHAIEVRPVAQRAAPEIDSLDTPGGSSTVISLNDDDGNAAVIWVTPDDSDTESL